MDKDTSVDVRAWPMGNRHYVAVQKIKHGEHMRKRVYKGVSRASVHRLICLVETHPLRKNIALVIYW